MRTETPNAPTAARVGIARSFLKVPEAIYRTWATQILFYLTPAYGSPRREKCRVPRNEMGRESRYLKCNSVSLQFCSLLVKAATIRWSIGLTKSCDSAQDDSGHEAILTSMDKTVQVSLCAGNKEKNKYYRKWENAREKFERDRDTWKLYREVRQRRCPATNKCGQKRCQWKCEHPASSVCARDETDGRPLVFVRHPNYH